MSVASAWLGDIGEYPPHPSRLSNTPLVRRLRLRTSGGIANLSGFGGYSPISPRHAEAIVSICMTVKKVENLAIVTEESAIMWFSYIF